MSNMLKTCYFGATIGVLLFIVHLVKKKKSHLNNRNSSRNASNGNRDRNRSLEHCSPPSASIPLQPQSCTYHVFLSFHGKDSRNGLTSHLHAALERKGIKTFIDNRDLEMGEVIKDELLKAIEESMFAITVLSPNYASSSWCLDELQHIVECSKKLGLSIVPVFYGVEPSDVRYQKEGFGKAFKEQEDRFGQNSEKVTGWRNALTEVANRSGKHFKDENEATLVESIAEHILRSLIPKLPSSTKNLVGINSRVAEVMTHVGIGLDDVRFIGIHGMGGIGKTTIATEIFKAIQGEFKVSCFLANVREARESNRIVDKQKQLLAKANINVNTSDNEHDVQTKIETFLRNKKVLLVLDDISDGDELMSLAREQDWFGPGSRIIITTRDIQLLKIHGVHGTYEVQGLVDSESLDLLCSKAFKQEKLDEKYLDVAKEVVKYSGGLPLALEVLGSHLFERCIDFWHSTIEQMKSQSAPTEKIHDTLKISYNSLNPMQKNVFLDIACFFKGNKTDDVFDVLIKCGYSPVDCIPILIERCLVKIDEYDEDNEVFEMHDLLQEMGRKIVIEESPKNPRKRSRLWSSEDINRVFQNNKGSEAIQGVVLEEGWSAPVQDWSAEAFSNMTQLKLLIVGGLAGVRCDFSSLPTSLRVLRWSFYLLKTLPLSDQQYELVEITLKFSKIKYLWHGQKFLRKLKHLDLSNSFQLKQTPDLSEVPNLQTLVLEGCEGLTKVHPSVVHHKSLILLDLTGCESLKALPGKLEMSSLKALLLGGCSRFENLPEFGKCMTSLAAVSLTSTSIKKLPTSLGCLVGLEHLNLHGCDKLECLPNITNGLPLLRTLILSDCRLTDESFPPDFGPFPSLTYLDLSDNDFVSMPINIQDSPKLECLKLNSCEKLRCLPELPSSIRELQAWGCWSLDISEFNILSTVCRAFVSPSQDPGQALLEMVIYGREIPPWFVRRQDGNSVSIPCDYPPNERLVIALCFQSISDGHSVTSGGNTCIEPASVADNGIKSNTIRISPGTYGRNHLHIFCLTNDYFSDGFHQDTCFEFVPDHFHLIEGEGEVPSMTSAARYVRRY